jgi:hypothetical protein
MIPDSGSITLISSSGALNTTTITHALLSGYLFTGSTQLIITTTPALALDAIRTTTTLYLNLAATANLASATRVTAQRSPISYSITNVSYASTTVTLTVSTLPVAPVAGQLIHIEGSSNSALNGTYTLTGTPTTTSLQFTLATDPGTGFTNGLVFPGIVNSVTGTGNGGVGYYTISRPALTNIGTTPSTPGNVLAANLAKAGFLIPAAATHVIAQSGTATFGNLYVDTIGSVAIPCGQLLSIKNLKGGSSFLATGTTAGTDIVNLIYATLNPFGSS